MYFIKINVEGGTAVIHTESFPSTHLIALLAPQSGDMAMTFQDPGNVKASLTLFEFI